MLALGISLGIGGLGKVSFRQSGAAPAFTGYLLYLAADANVSSGAVSSVSGAPIGAQPSVQATGSAQPSISSGVITFDGTSDILDGAWDGPDATFSSQSLPDASGGDTGEGFTCTGLARLANGNWAIGNDGRHTQAAPGTQVSGVVIVSSDFSTKVAEYLTGDYDSSATTSVQGVALQDATHLWFVAQDLNKLICIDPADGTLQFSLTLAYTPNGLGWDSLRNELIVHDQTNNLLKWTNPATGAVSQSKAISANCDQIFFDAAYGAEGAVYWSEGTNGTDGNVFVLDVASGLTSQSSAFEDNSERRFSGSTAIEGIYFERTSGLLHVVNDRYFHLSQTGGNEVRTYHIQPPASATNFAMFFKGKGNSAAPASTVAIMAPARASSTNSVPLCAVFQSGGAKTLAAGVRLNGVTSIATFSLSDATVDSLFWVEFDLPGNSATLYVDGGLVQTAAFGTAPNGVPPFDKSPSAGAGEYTGGAIARPANCSLRAWGMCWNTTGRAFIEGLVASA